MILPTSIDHLVFRVTSITTTEAFYAALLGQPAFKTEGLVMFTVGNTRLFFTAVSAPATHPYNKDEIGLNHIALGVPTLADLQAISTQLDTANITHSAIKLDPHGGKEYIWLNDPDGFRVEFYLREE